MMVDRLLTLVAHVDIEFDITLVIIYLIKCIVLTTMAPVHDVGNVVNLYAV